MRNLLVLGATFLLLAPQPGGHPMRPRKGARMFLMMILRHMDKNQDQRISQQEYRDFFLELFDAWDANDDGFATPEEVRKAWERLRHRLMWRRMDKDGDGKISREEWRGPPEVFQKLDKNGDGFLTPEELKEHRKDFRSLDKNGDGKLSPEEFPGPHEVFRRLDANGDGAIDETEWKKAHEGRRLGPRGPRHHMGPPGRGPRHRMGPRHRGRMGPHFVPGMRLFIRMDRDKDKRVSRSEVEAFIRESFPRLDRNGDGFLDKQDRPSGPRPLPSLPEGEEPFQLP